MHKLNRQAFVPLSLRQKVCIVLVFWLVSLGLLYILNGHQYSHVIIDSAAVLHSVSIKNHLGRCRFGLSDPADNQYLGTVSFESLKTSGANTGTFRTAALREMEIQQLKIDLAGPGRALLTPVANTTPVSSCSDSQHWSQNLMAKYLQHLDKQDLIQTALPDFSHLVQIRINDFECRFLEGQTAVLHIQSKKASLQAENAGGLLLRGHVIIRTPAMTLESDNILWDVQNQTFQAQGFYCIRTENGLEKGYRGFFGPTLNKIIQHQAFANKGEVK